MEEIKWICLSKIGYGCYSVSNDGVVRNDRTGKTLSPYINTRGYYIVSLSLNGLVKKVKIHRLVAECFLNRVPDTVVNHIDGNSINNHADNLEWITQSENLHHAFMIGLTDKVKKGVRCINSGVAYDSSYSASKKTGIPQGSISNACSGVRRSAGGFHWEWILN